MLISKFFISDFSNRKKNRSFSENSFNKIKLVIVCVFLFSIFLIYESNKVNNSSKFEFLNKLLMNNGFIIKNIEIKGANRLNKKYILKIINAYKNVNIFSLNLEKIHQDIKKITWIKEGSVKIVYPDTIKIFLTEKEPIAILQNKDKNNLITKDGEIIFEKNINNFKYSLPIIIGKNANLNIYSILEILKINKDVADNIWSLTFVNERRWDIHFNQGLTIRLPSKNVQQAWVKFVSLHENFNILNLGLTEIDLRNSNQILGKISVDKKLIFKKKNL